MKLSKRIAAFAAAMVMSVSAMGISASAENYPRCDDKIVSNCKTSLTTSYKHLKRCMVYLPEELSVSNDKREEIYVGDLYGRCNVFKTKVKCKVESALCDHDAVVSSKNAKCSKVKEKDVAAITGWAKLSDSEKAYFGATFYID